MIHLVISSFIAVRQTVIYLVTMLESPNYSVLFAEYSTTFKRPSHDKLNLANLCWQTQVCVCERDKTVGEHVGKQLQQIELASILANFFTIFFVLVNSYLTCERLANMGW